MARWTLGPGRALTLEGPAMRRIMGDDGPSIHSCYIHPLSAEDWRIIDRA